MSNKPTEYLKLRRVAFGNRKTAFENREYAILGTSGPVGTLDEWKANALEKGIKNIVAFDENRIIDTVYEPKCVNNQKTKGL